MPAQNEHGLEGQDLLRRSEAMAELSRKLGLLERARHVCSSVDIQLPGIVVTGEQSAGKSSLLENISGIQFPRAQNTCTRMPCVLTLITEDDAEPYAQVSMDPSFHDVQKCKIQEVEEKIKGLTERYATGDSFISKDPIFVRVVRNQGPQLSLIDLPGLTHNADKMDNIHEVTKGLVEEYIQQEEMVILCVIPAMSDFGNAEVIKLARKYDIDGKRTLGVVTKCDDAARAEASDVVEKVLMKRGSDVKLKLGFHCVVNRSQKNIDEGMTQDQIWEKEVSTFKKMDRFKKLPEEIWGTLRLAEKIGKIQSSRLDECFPKIREAMRAKISEFKKHLQQLPEQPETDASRHRHFDLVLRRVNEDLSRRVRAEFMGGSPDDKKFAIAPRVAEMVRNFGARLRGENPDWLGEYMLNEVEQAVKDYVNGYTVDNLVGPQVFVNLIKRVFVEDGLLADAAGDLADQVAEHLHIVIGHVIAIHATLDFPSLSNRLIDVAHEVIDSTLLDTRGHCEYLAQAQQVTSTTHGQYMVKLTQFRKSMLEKALDTAKALMWSDSSEDSVGEALPKEFIDMAENAHAEPQRLAVLEICASLHVYSKLLIEGYVDMSAKLVKFTMVEKLTENLELKWRSEFENKMGELFPVDHELLKHKQDIEKKLSELQALKDQLATLRASSRLNHSIQPGRTRFGQKSADCRHGNVSEHPEIKVISGSSLSKDEDEDDELKADDRDAEVEKDDQEFLELGEPIEMMAGMAAEADQSSTAASSLASEISTRKEQRQGKRVKNQKMDKSWNQVVDQRNI